MVFFLSSERLKADLLNDNVADEYIRSAIITTISGTVYQELLDSYIVPFLEFCAMAELVLTTSFKVGNIGLYSNYDANANQNELSTVKYVEKHYRQKAEFYRNRMVKYLAKNKDSFPEYDVCGCDSITNPSTNTITKTGIWLGGK